MNPLQHKFLDLLLFSLETEAEQWTRRFLSNEDAYYQSPFYNRPHNYRDQDEKTFFFSYSLGQGVEVKFPENVRFNFKLQNSYWPWSRKRRLQRALRSHWHRKDADQQQATKQAQQAEKILEQQEAWERNHQLEIEQLRAYEAAMKEFNLNYQDKPAYKLWLRRSKLSRILK